MYPAKPSMVTEASKNKNQNSSWWRTLHQNNMIQDKIKMSGTLGEKNHHPYFLLQKLTKLKRKSINLKETITNPARKSAILYLFWLYECFAGGNSVLCIKVTVSSYIHLLYSSCWESWLLMIPRVSHYGDDVLCSLVVLQNIAVKI